MSSVDRPHAGSAARSRPRRVPGSHYVLALTALVLMGFLGFAAYITVAAIRLRTSAVADASMGAGIFLVASFLVLACFLVTVVALARSRVRVVPVVVLLALLLGSPLVTVAGAKIGLDVAARQVSADAAELVDSDNQVSGFFTDLIDELTQGG